MKYRYQNKNFKSQVDKARHYKREARKIPQTFREIFLAKVGLDSWVAKIALVLVLGLMVYFTYVPNFLYIKNIEVNGLKVNEREQVISITNELFKKNSLWPQKNILFFNSGKLKSVVEKSVLNVREVKKIERKFPNTLVVEILPRYAKFVSRDQINSFEISADGIVLSVNPAEATLGANLTKLNFSNPDTWVVGQKIIQDKTAEYVAKIQAGLPSVSNLKVADIYIKGKEQQDIEVDTQSGYKLKFDLKTDLEESLKNLKGLFTVIPANAHLAYIDLRVPERAYVCYENTACALDTPIVAGSATSTPGSGKSEDQKSE